jgi:hypothetical protein
MNTTRLIEAYLDGSLEKDIAKEIQTRAENDFEFAELIRLHKEINESIRDNELDSLRRDLRGITGRKDPSNDRDKFPLRQIFRIAAVFFFVLLIGVGVLKWFIPGYSGLSIFEKYYIKYEPDVITRSDNTYRISLLNAQYLYQTGRYSECAGLLENLVRNEKENYIAWFYLGLARIEQNQPIEAIHDFLSIPSEWENPYSIHRNWYLALCLINSGQEKQAISLLEGLSATDGYYADRAKIILGRIRI